MLHNYLSDAPASSSAHWAVGRGGNGMPIVLVQISDHHGSQVRIGLTVENSLQFAKALRDTVVGSSFPIHSYGICVGDDVWVVLRSSGNARVILDSTDVGTTAISLCDEDVVAFAGAIDNMARSLTVAV